LATSQGSGETLRRDVTEGLVADELRELRRKGVDS